METVGNYLKKEREARNISLREVARLTKISEFYLDYLEKDDYERLPQGPYIKGYIYSYVRLIGGNTDEALRLYDSLHKQKSQTEVVEPEISKDKGWQASIASSLKSIVSLLNKKNNGQKIQPEMPKSKSRKTSTAFFGRKIGSSFNGVFSSLKAKTSSLKTAFLSPKTIIVPFKAITALSKIVGSILKAAMSSSKTIVSSLKATLNTNRWLFDKRTGLYACFVLLSSTILVLAGFGFYHLFIYPKNPSLVADLRVLQDKGSKTTLPMNAEKNVLPSRSNDAFMPSNQPEEFAKNKGLFPRLKAPVSLESLSPLSSNSAAEVSRETSSSEDLSKPSRSATKMSTLHSKTTLPAEKPASEEITAGEEMSAQSHHRLISARLSAESYSAYVNIDVLEATICGDIKDRMPAGVGNSFPWSIDRVYVWSLVKAKHLPSKIRHIYYFRGQKVSDVALNVRSSYWRTWSYKTISNKRYQGRWRVDIASAEGQVLRSFYFEVN